MLRILLAISIAFSVANGAAASPEVDNAASTVAAQIERLNSIETLGKAAAMTGSGARFDECASGLLRDIRDVRTNRLQQQKLLTEILTMEGSRTATVLTRIFVSQISQDIKLIETMSGIVIQRAALCNSKQLDQTAAMAAVTFKEMLGQLDDMRSYLSRALPAE